VLIDREKAISRYSGQSRQRDRAPGRQSVQGVGRLRRPNAIRVGDEMLSDRELPTSVIFIGGGVISPEFGPEHRRWRFAN
jgi:hypothetical protein